MLCQKETQAQFEQLHRKIEFMCEPEHGSSSMAAKKNKCDMPEHEKSDEILTLLMIIEMIRSF